MYYVYLNGHEITDVESVEATSARCVNRHYGLGKGYFSIADDRDLKAWSISCQQESTELFKLLDKLIETQEESRLVITSDAENISQLVYLESYSKSEQNAGVFDVTLKFIEYVPVSVRTTNIPYIKRPGKMPVVTKIINGKKANGIRKPKPFKLCEWQRKQYEQWGKDYVAYNTKMFQSDGEPVINPILLPPDAEIYISSHERERFEYMSDEEKRKFIEKLRENKIIQEEVVNEKAAKKINKQNEKAAKKIYKQKTQEENKKKYEEKILKEAKEMEKRLGKLQK